MLADHYVAVRTLHMGCVAASGSLFCVRATLTFAGIAGAHHRAVRRAAIGVDTLLLAAGILLTLTIGQYPLHDAWLTTKLALLVCYIGLGHLALRRAGCRAWRMAAFAGAVLTFAYIVGIAVAHHPASWFAVTHEPG